MKKSLAILLSLALILCMIPTTAFGAESDVIVLDSATFTYDGQVHKPVPTKVVVNGTSYVKDTDYTVSYVKEKENTDVDPKDAGKYRVKLSKKEDAGTSFPSEDKYAPFEIKKFNFTTNNVTVRIDNQINSGTNWDDLKASAHYYVNGTEVISPHWKDVVTGTVSQVTAGKVYKVSFSYNDNTNYEGTIPDTTFNIASDIGASTVEVRANYGYSIKDNVIYAGTYNGSIKNVYSMFTLYDKTAKTTIGSANYTVTTDNADKTEIKNAEIYSLTIKGQNAYGGTKTGYSVKIDPKDVNAYNSNIYIEPINEDYVAGQLPSELSPKIRDNSLNVDLVKGTDYTIDTPHVDGSGRGYIIVRFKGNYTGDKTVYFNVVPSDKNIGNMFVYFGNSLVTGTYKFPDAYMYNQRSQALTNIKVYTDYTKKNELSSSYWKIQYEYKDKKGVTVKTTAPVDAQTYSVYLVGQNGYGGKKLLGTYTIPKYKFDYVTISASAGSVANKPKITVRSSFENFVFEEGKDYTVTYSSYVSSNKMWITVNSDGRGNLETGSKSDYYQLVTKSIASCNAYFTNGRNSAAYTGRNIPVDVIVKDGYYTTLKKGTDYTVEYKNSLGKTVPAIKDAGTYRVVIKGTGAYSGTLELTFTVIGTDISGYTVTLRESSVNYDGRSHMPSIVSIKKGYYSSLSSNDYTVTYQGPDGKEVSAYNIKNAGTYKVIVTGKNGYSGSIYAEYRIIGKPQTVTVTGKPSGKIYATSDTFKLTGYATGAGSKVTYSSSNPSVASVSSSGYVTPKKVGKTVITVSTYGDTSYEPATKEVTIVISPKKAVITQKPWTSGQKKLFKVRWNYQEGATRYQIMYSQDKSFRKGTYKLKSVDAHNLKAETQSTAVKGLKSGKRYYVKVRAIYQDKDYRGRVVKNYWGTWSNWRSVVVK